MTIINSIASWIIKKRIHQIDLFRKYPIEVQNEHFKQLIASAKNTVWGIKHDYKSISNVNDFRQRVPLQDYESLKPYIERAMKGEQDLLWPGEVKWFAKSSGTTSDKSKFIPVTEESLEECHYKCGKDMLSIYCNNFEITQIFSGKSLMLGGSHHINEMNNETYIGDLSAVLIQNMPLWAQFLRSPERSIALMDNWEEKIEKMADVTMKENITNIAGVPSWTLVLLKRVLEKSGKQNLLEVWPNLELFMHGGVSFSPYKAQFQKLIPSPKMNYLETYNASEGFFGISDIPGSDEILLMLDYGIFYEFIPMEEFGQKNPQAITLENVKTNENYALVISTNAGLWRYIIGDTIKFTSLNPFRIKITGRTKHFINAFGEELMIENAEKALSIACEKTKAQIKDYTAGPIFMDEDNTGGHQWLIEFEKEPENLEKFTTYLDNALKTVNSDYEAKRFNDFVLKMPLVNIMKENTFYEWLKSKGKLGGQNKVPRLANDRKFIEEILSLRI
ncbi:MAG: GH3 auxin-responsive promoter family protein [Bacteroidetes bacterium]|nr:GH3 auxin-responsive promoter family protein [Bacteroidota bacterium]HET6243512.1 GH3 auxin-responsive promoter family protein [Bacteroidia bacterium]